MCVQKYLTQEDVRDPVCMNTSCGKAWIYDFLVDNMTKSFMTGEYKRHRERICFETETSFMPATQLELEYDLRVQHLASLIAQKKELIAQLKKEIQVHNTEMIFARRDHGNGETKVARTFIRACPGDGCRGFLSTKWKCGLCNVRVCKDCHEIKGEDTHVCDPSILENVKALEKDSKNCPKCSAVIFKIDGCDQMFCTQCHTAFSWKTMAIVSKNSRIHNPHYFEWLRSQSPTGEIRREEGDNVCNMMRLPHVSVFTPLFKGGKWDYIVSYETRTLFNEVYTLIAHVIDEEMVRKYPASQPINMWENMDIRKLYLQNEITKEQLQLRLQQREKKRNKNNEINEVMQMFSQVCIDKMRRLADIRFPTITDKADKAAAITIEIERTIQEIDKVRVFFNEACLKIGKRYNCAVPVIDEKWSRPLKTVK